MKATALAVSAREHGNCYDLARLVLDQLASYGAETELVNFFDHRITPCQKCHYECLEHLDPAKGTRAPCPIDDDVRDIWMKTWRSDLLFVFVPTYGGLPPALWTAFSQRSQSFFREAPAEKLKNSVVSAVVLASPHQSSGASWIASLMSDEVKGLGMKVVGFEIINQAQFEIEYIFDRLIKDEEIRRRMRFMADRSWSVACQLAGVDPATAK